MGHRLEAFLNFGEGGGCSNIIQGGFSLILILGDMWKLVYILFGRSSLGFELGCGEGFQCISI